jgi:hypothetical protein
VAYVLVKSNPGDAQSAQIKKLVKGTLKKYSYTQRAVQHVELTTIVEDLKKELGAEVGIAFLYWPGKPGSRIIEHKAEVERGLKKGISDITGLRRDAIRVSFVDFEEVDRITKEVKSECAS